MNHWIKLKNSLENEASGPSLNYKTLQPQHNEYKFFMSFAFDLWTAYRHVGLAASVHGLGHGVDQVAADPEVTHLHLTLRVDQHVGGLHVCGGQRAKGKKGNLSLATAPSACVTLVQPPCRFSFSPSRH